MTREEQWKIKQLTMKWLIEEKGYDVNTNRIFADGLESKIPILCLVAGGRIKNASEICELFIQYGADIDKLDGCGCPPIWYAVGSSNYEIFKILLSHGARCDWECNGHNLLHTAAMGADNQKIAKRLIELGVSLDLRTTDTSLGYPLGCKPLDIASILKNEDMAKYLASQMKLKEE